MELSRQNQTMTSLQIAESSGKDHKHVLEAIRTMEPSWIKVGKPNFRLTSYTDASNRQKPMYELNRSECLYIATKFNDEARAKLIIRWEELEKPRTHLEVIQSEMALLIENESLKIENNKMRPRSEFVEKVFNTDALIDIGEVAKILKLPYGRNTLFQVLKYENIFFKHKNEPYQQYVAKGYFELKEGFKERKNNSPLLIVQTLVTQKGLGFIAKKLGVINI